MLLNILKLIPTRVISAYTLSNGLNSIAMLMFLPALAANNSTGAKSAAYGLLVSQIAAIFGSYAFSITTPRTIKNLGHKNIVQLMMQIFLIQIIISAVAFLALLYIVNQYFDFAICAFIVGISMVFQWQWFHIPRDSARGQIKILLITRLIIIYIEVMVFSGASKFSMEVYPLVLLALLFVMPAYSSLRFLAKSSAEVCDHRFRDLSLLSEEIKVGSNLFFSGLISSIYTMGPSVLCGIYSPANLVLMQQFDRVRSSFSNLTGMIISSKYPIYVSMSKEDLVSKFNLTKKYIFNPTLYITFILILLIPLTYSLEPIYILQKLQLTNEAFILALIGGLLSSSTNVISLTFLHPLESDRLYLKVIFLGSALFIASVIIGYAVPGILNFKNILMSSACIAELLIFTLLLKKAIHISEEAIGAKKIEGK